MTSRNSFSRYSDCDLTLIATRLAFFCKQTKHTKQDQLFRDIFCLLSRSSSFEFISLDRFIADICETNFGCYLYVYILFIFSLSRNRSLIDFWFSVEFRRFLRDLNCFATFPTLDTIRRFEFFARLSFFFFIIIYDLFHLFSLATTNGERQPMLQLKSQFFSFSKRIFSFHTHI